MKKITLFTVSMAMLFTSCLNLESDPLVTVNPQVAFSSHVKGGDVVVVSTVAANPIFVDPGSIATVFDYEGTLELYDGETGELLTSATIEGDGLRTVVEASVAVEDFESMVIILTGTVAAYADRESDGDASNDLLMHRADFYEVVNLDDLLERTQYPIVTLEPVVDFQLSIRNEELYATTTVRANPDYLVTGSEAIVILYDGVVQLYDEVSGSLLKSTKLEGDGLSSVVTLLQDTVSYDGFVLIASGTVSCFADIENDGDPENDLFVSSAEFSYSEQLDMRE